MQINLPKDYNNVKVSRHIINSIIQKLTILKFDYHQTYDYISEGECRFLIEILKSSLNQSDVIEYSEKLKEYDILVIMIKNILKDAGIPEYKKFPDDDLSTRDEVLETGGYTIPLAKRVEMLAERYKNVVNMSKTSYVITPADKDAKMNITTIHINDNMVFVNGKQIGRVGFISSNGVCRLHLNTKNLPSSVQIDGKEFKIATGKATNIYNAPSKFKYKFIHDCIKLVIQKDEVIYHKDLTITEVSELESTEIIL